MRVGGIIALEHRIPAVDTFSFTQAGAPWVNQPWLMQLQYFALHRLGGYALVAFVHALWVTFGYALASLPAGKAWGRRAAAVATLLGMVVGSHNWAVRPQAFSFFAFGAVLFFIERHRRGGSLAPLVPLFALWANAHGGFVFGLVALGLYVACRAIEERRLAGRPAAVLALSALATALNPRGPHGIVSYVTSFVRSPATLRLNEEFQRMSPFEEDGVVFFATFALVAFAMTRRPRPSLDRLATFLVFAALAFFARRNAAWFGMVLIPIGAELLSHRWPEPTRPPRGASALAIVFAVAGVAALPFWRRDLLRSDTPEEAMGFLCENAPESARVFQEETFGVYQIWRCPRLPVFIDTRYELYPSEQWNDYLTVSAARPGWESVAERSRFSHLFLSTSSQARAIEAAGQSQAWREIHRDARAVIFERKNH